MNPEQTRIANELLRQNPRMRFGLMVDLLLQRAEFSGMARDDLLITLARQAWILELPK